MIQYLEKLHSNIFLCGVEISLSGIPIPSNIDGWQPFHNYTITGAEFKKVFASISSIEFGEESFDTNAGTAYKLKVIFKFKNNDANRTLRSLIFTKVSFIKLKLTNSLDLVIGKNDWNQNTKPKFKMKSNHQFTEFEYEINTISPAGYTPNPNSFQLPSLIPLTLL